MRVFVAVWPDEPTAAALAALPRPDVGGVRWTPPEQWHVTLRFCGRVADQHVPELADALGERLADHSATQAVLGPSTARLGTGVLHVPVAGLDALAAAVRAASAPFGDVHDDRPFLGHLTLARAGRGRHRRGPATPAARPRIPAALVGAGVSGSWPVEVVTVVSSTMGAGGPTYRVVGSVPLGGP